jgi:hypothetical protein
MKTQEQISGLRTARISLRCESEKSTMKNLERPDGSVGILNRLGPGRSRIIVWFPGEANEFFFFSASRPALVRLLSPILYIYICIYIYVCVYIYIYITNAFLGVKTSLVRQVHYFPPSRADVKCEHSYIANASCAVFIFTEQNYPLLHLPEKPVSVNPNLKTSTSTPIRSLEFLI